MGKHEFRYLSQEDILNSCLPIMLALLFIMYWLQRPYAVWRCAFPRKQIVKKKTIIDNILLLFPVLVNHKVGICGFSCGKQSTLC